MQKTALIIVDMQVGMSWPGPAERNNHQADRSPQEVNAMALSNLHGEYATVIQAQDAISRLL
jgi:hypothetical protein